MAIVHKQIDWVIAVCVDSGPPNDLIAIDCHPCRKTPQRDTKRVVVRVRGNGLIKIGRTNRDSGTWPGCDHRNRICRIVSATALIENANAVRWP